MKTVRDLLIEALLDSEAEESFRQDYGTPAQTRESIGRTADLLLARFEIVRPTSADD